MQFRERHTLAILERFSQQTLPLDLFLNHYFRAHKALGSKDRKAVSDTIYALIRWLGLLDYFCAAQKPAVSNKWSCRLQVWRECSPLQFLNDPTIPLHQRASTPKQLFERLKSHYGEEKAFELSLINNQTAPTTIRINPLKTTRTDLIQKWQNFYQFSLTPYSSLGIVFKEKIHLLSLPEFEEGLFEIQDEGSQLIAEMIEARPGEQVLDYCAGSGGKSLAFAYKLGGKGQVYLHDIRKFALDKAKKRFKRAGIENVQFALHPRLKGKMDWVLVDVPCSGLGTLRRNPDLKWKWSLEVMQRLIEQQRTIFKEALAYVKEGGHILYATCSILPEENEEQLAYFLETYPLELVPPPFQSLPTEGGMDGFYGALLRKKPAASH